MEFKIIIREILEKEVSIVAETAEDALRKVKDNYDDVIYELDYNDIQKTEFEIVKECE